MVPSPRWTGTQRRIGLTGGIASGKSTLARWLAQHKLPVLDADTYARDALAPGTIATQTILERFGETVRAQGHSSGLTVIDRGALGQIVFQDPEERRWLEELVHPLVRQRFEAELANLAAEPAVVLMIPLLFEAGLEGLCSEIWLVDCEPEQQLERLMKRDQLSEADARARIKAQWPMERKRGLADQLIQNKLGQNELERSAEQAWSRQGDHLPSTLSHSDRTERGTTW
jgi:dephospho-CoA kinase